MGDLATPYPPASRNSSNMVAVDPSGPFSMFSLDTSSALYHSNGPVGALMPPHFGSAAAPLLYVGVTLQRPPDVPSWGMSAFLFDKAYLTIGRIQQDLMHSITTSAWVTAMPVAASILYGYGTCSQVQFCESFRKHSLYPTSALQLVPGDVIISINGRPVSSFPDLVAVMQYLDTTTQLSVVAVRHERSRREAYNMLTYDSGTLQLLDRDFRAADLAYRMIRPFLRMVPSPSLCRKQLDFFRSPLFGVGHRQDDAAAPALSMYPPPPARAVRIVTPESSLASFPSSNHGLKRPLDGLPEPHQQCAKRVKLVSIPQAWRNPWFRDSRGHGIPYCDMFEDDPDEGTRAADFLPPVEPFSEWLARRKAAWSKARRAKRRSLVFVAVSLQRASLDRPWGIVISMFDKTYLGIGCVQGQQHSLTAWARAASSLPLEALTMPFTTDTPLQKLFESQSHQINTALQLQAGDVILSINGRPIPSFSGLTGVTRYMKQSMNLTIVALRDGNLRIPFKLGPHKQSKDDIRNSAFRLAATAYRCIRLRLCSDPELSRLHQFLQSESASSSTQAVTVRTGIPRLGNSVIAVGGSWTKTGNHWRWLPHKHPRNSVHVQPHMHLWRNPLFRDKSGKHLPFDDQLPSWADEHGIGVDGVEWFLPPITTSTFPQWLKDRKATWRKKWEGCLPVVSDIDDTSWEDDEDDDVDALIGHDFWTHQGFPSFQHWLLASTKKWKVSYSWNREKRKRIEQECEKVVRFPCSNAPDHDAQWERWLRVRKNQWRICRRKIRRRRREEQRAAMAESANAEKSVAHEGELVAENVHLEAKAVSEGPFFSSLKNDPCSLVEREQASEEMIVIDALLDEQEERLKEEEVKPLFDISFLFDARLGAPDDVVAHCLKFLHRSEHGKLLCISSSTRSGMKERNIMWRQLCPSQWILPRKPRKPWALLYIQRIRQEEETSRKRSDDVLNKASQILFKGDYLHKIEKLVSRAEQRFGFDINYSSGVVCERNCLLNLAVIHGRHKIVRWLVEVKNADLESCDRGSFTPLINAAWAGDRYLVRFLLSHGSDRSKVGTGHYTEALAPPDFEGLNAEGWARKKGHHDLAELIRFGL